MEKPGYKGNWSLAPLCSYLARSHIDLDWIDPRPSFLVDYFGSVADRFEMFTFSTLTAWIDPRPIQLASENRP